LHAQSGELDTSEPSDASCRLNGQRAARSEEFLVRILRSSLWLVLALALPARGVASDPREGGPAGLAAVYAADFVATAANGIAMNDAGDVVGTSYQDIGCGPFCLPPQDVVVWRGGTRIVLPKVPGLSFLFALAF
jgi:hypothetical protein